MRKNLNIFAVAALLVAQACGTKSDSANEKVDTEVSTVKDEVAVPTSAERKAERQREITLWEEKHALEVEQLAKVTPSYTDRNGKIVYNKAESQPEFVGGKEAMMKYLNDNIVFPKEAEANGLEATIFTDFVVSADGTVRR